MFPYRFFLFCLFLLSFLFESSGKNQEASVVKIYSISSSPNYYDPWKLNSTRSGSGSGSIIAGNRILTNAHVVADSKFIQVRKREEAQKYIAQVEFVSHEYDLAILKLEDESFFENMIPLEIGELPLLRDQVITLGYPIGGDILSITEGVVSRIEHRRYVHSGRYLLTCQTDASINPGNSGGPVLKDGKIVGVAFQGGGGDNIGYFIPTTVLKHFLKDIEDGTYDGMGSLGIHYQEMESPNQRAFYGLQEDQTGVLVSHIAKNSTAEGVLQTGDVILKIGDYEVEIDGTIELRKGERTLLSYATQTIEIGDELQLEIIRDKKKLRLKTTLKSEKSAKQKGRKIAHDVLPSYYIFGGLVFEPLSENYLKSWGNNWFSRAPFHLVNEYYDISKENTEDIPILVKVLTHEANVGYEGQRDWVVKKINDKEIQSFREMIEIIENSTEKYIVIEDIYKKKIILDRKEAIESGKEIMEKYAVPQLISDDVKEFLE